MHQPRTGGALKGIDRRRAPSVSLYTRLPRRFGFEATGQVPEFFVRDCGKRLDALARGGEPLFWQLVG